MTIPKWLADIGSFAPISTHFILSGNVRDIYPIGKRLESIERAIWIQLRDCGYDALLLWRPYEGLRLIHSKKTRDAPEAAVRQACGLSAEPGPRLHDDPKETELRLALQAWGNGNPALAGTAMVVDCMGDVNAMIDASSFVLGELLERQAMTGQTSLSPIFWVAPNSNDVPHWFANASSRIRQIVIPLPDRAARCRIGERLFADAQTSAGLAERGFSDATAFGEALAEATHNHTAMALRSIVAIAARPQANPGSGDPQSMLLSAATHYRLGDMETSPWESGALQNSVAGAEDLLNREVIGQQTAAKQVTNILYRSFSGLSGAHVGKAGSRPRGVLFFAGPTGVGKTEMAKTIAKIVFGDQDHYLRFDMSEFSESHTVARLIGAPPGYVGFNDGGELVNAIRENPFRVILFDEIEKADRAILDKFLQILEDGRLTDGRGQTVYFSDCLIIFTSNLGVSRKIVIQEIETTETVVHHDDPPDEVRSKILAGVRSHFKDTINRPELLNRIGENILVFQFIGENEREKIADKFLTNVARRMNEKGIVLELSDHARSQIYAACSTTEVMEQGGRGIGSRVETLVVNALGRFMFENRSSASGKLTITQVLGKDGQEVFDAVFI